MNDWTYEGFNPAKVRDKLTAKERKWIEKAMKTPTPETIHCPKCDKVAPLDEWDCMGLTCEGVNDDVPEPEGTCYCPGCAEHVIPLNVSSAGPLFACGREVRK